jgi:hypothetical protein
MVPKWHPNGTQMVPKWYPNGTQMVPKWYPNGHRFVTVSSPFRHRFVTVCKYCVLCVERRAVHWIRMPPKHRTDGERSADDDGPTKQRARVELSGTVASCPYCGFDIAQYPKANSTQKHLAGHTVLALQKKDLRLRWRLCQAFRERSSPFRHRFVTVPSSPLRDRSVTVP